MDNEILLWAVLLVLVIDQQRAREPPLSEYLWFAYVIVGRFTRTS